MRSTVKLQVAESISKLEGKLVPQGPGVNRYLTLPKEGWTEQQVRAELDTLGEMEHTRWEDGKVSGAVYHGGNALVKLQAEAFEKFSVSNPIHPDVFPGVRKMEAEVVAMVLSMFNAPHGAAGVTTSGGTESILMACLGARQKAYVERGVTEPEMCVWLLLIASPLPANTVSGLFRKQPMQHFGRQALTSASKSTSSLVPLQHTAFGYSQSHASSTAIPFFSSAPRHPSLMAS